MTIAMALRPWALAGAAFLACACQSVQSLAPPDTPDRHEFAHEVVAADHPLASEAGAEILRMGGNAVDAGVATSFALSVVRPYSCGIGGGGFMLILLRDAPGSSPGAPFVTAMDYRERAPGAITPLYFQDKPAMWSRTSGAGVAIPGTVAGLLEALDRYGTLDRRTVLEPAIRLAREGFKADRHFLAAIDAIPDDAAWLQETYALPARHGRTIRVPEAARALEWIAAHGRRGFYEGPVARAIVARARMHGGILTLADLRSYQPKEVDPLVGSFRGATVYAMPLPSSGGITVLQVLGILDARRDLLDAALLDRAAWIHLLAEAMKHAFADRAQWLADPEYTDVPVARLLAPEYLQMLASSIDAGRTFESSHYGSRAFVRDDSGTSHFCVIDRWGNAVACTETINLEWGSTISVPEAGICLNNQMDDFTTHPGQANAFGLTQSDANLPAPGKRPLSSMSPTIITDADGAVQIVAGASGGPRIITGTLQAMLNVMLRHMNAQDAVAAARIHHQWIPDTLWFEPGDSVWRPGAHPAYESDPALARALRKRGHTLDARKDIGNVQLIRRSDTGWDAASDPRKGGRPAGR